MALSNPENDKHKQHSMVVVPLDSPGIEIKRILQAFGDYDAPFGHGEMHFTNVRVPKENLLVGMGNDFPLARFAAGARALRLADGPDEVHKGMVARLELKKYQ
jgi:acyl-CoA dehydrogenase